MQKSRNINGPDEENFFGQLISKYVPYWPLVGNLTVEAFF